MYTDAVLLLLAIVAIVPACLPAGLVLADHVPLQAPPPSHFLRQQQQQQQQQLPPLPRGFAPVYGPVEQKDSIRIAPRYASSSYQKAYDPEWLKKYNLRPPRQPAFPPSAAPGDGIDGFVRMPLKSRHPSPPAPDQGESGPETEPAKRKRSLQERLADWPTADGPGYTMVREDSVFGVSGDRPVPVGARRLFGLNSTSAGAGNSSSSGTGDLASGPRKWAWEHLREYGVGGIGFLAHADIGTPPQRNYLILDSGTVWSWANPLCSDTEDDNFCLANGRYSPAASNTSQASQKNFTYLYGAGNALGTMYTDVVLIDNTYRIPKFPFGVATSSQQMVAGAMGVAYSEKVMSIVTALSSYGLIHAPVFSIGLGNQGENLGEIVFGGVNHFKYAGQLQPVPMTPSFGEQEKSPDYFSDWFQWSLHLNAMGYQFAGQQNVTMHEAQGDYIIDSGTTLSYGPDSLVGRLGSAMWAIRTEPDNLILVNCALRDMNGTVQFYFNDSKLRIDMKFRDFLLTMNETHCYLGVQPASVYNSSNILGTTFMRGAYMVFEPTMECIWMASYYSCGDGVLAVGVNPGDTQEAIGQCT